MPVPRPYPRAYGPIRRSPHELARLNDYARWCHTPQGRLDRFLDDLKLKNAYAALIGRLPSEREMQYQ